MLDTKIKCELFSCISFKYDNPLLRISSQVDVNKEKRLLLGFLPLLDRTLLPLVIQVDNA